MAGPLTLVARFLTGALESRPLRFSLLWLLVLCTPRARRDQRLPAGAKLEGTNCAAGLPNRQFTLDILPNVFRHVSTSSLLSGR